jgi:BA14K-like protein
MSVRVRILTIAAVLAASIALIPLNASAAPNPAALAIKGSAAASVLDVGWRRGRGWGVGAGLVGGVIIGEALAAPYYYDPYYAGPYIYAPGPAYYPDPYYDPGPVYYVAPYRRAPAYVDRGYVDAEAYCIRRFRSYDPASGTYLGYDGLRHPCP